MVDFLLLVGGVYGFFKLHSIILELQRESYSLKLKIKLLTKQIEDIKKGDDL